jgi:flavin-dependent dehydrogenase
MNNPADLVDNLVIGGGLAGSMIAIRLAEAGRAVTLLEKERESHHKVCGEFLSPEAVDYLRQVSIDPLSLGAATIRFVRLSSKGREVESPLPFTALSLSRSTLDQAMLTCVAHSGCTVHRGVLVEGLAANRDLWCVQLRGRDPLHARNVFLAAGKRDLRGWTRAPSRQGDMVAFKLHWRLEPAQAEALRDFIELFLFTGGYGGISLIERDLAEGDLANLCLVVRRDRLRDLGNWPALLASILEENPLLRRRLQGAIPMWPRPLALSSIPFGYLSAKASGLWRLGDQAAVIPSFSGDGIAIALHSAALAAETYLAGGSPELFTRRLRRQLRPAMSLSTLISRLLDSGVGRSLIPVALSIFPAAIQWIAASTRIPMQSRLSSPKPQPLSTAADAQTTIHEAR